MKKFIAVMLLACLSMSISLTAVAANSDGAVTKTSDGNEIVSIEEYVAAVQEEAAKYGIRCYLIDYDPDFKITREMLEAEVERIRKAGGFVVQEIGPGQQEVTVSEARDIISYSIARAMPVTKNVYNTFRVASPLYGSATIRVDANVTVNVQNGDVMSVNSVSARPTGVYVGLKSWKTSSITKSLNKPYHGYISLNVKGEAVFARDSSGTEIGYIADVQQLVTIDCNKGG